MRRAALRIGLVFAVLAMLPFPLGLVPGTAWLRDVCEAPFELGIDLLAALFGLEPPSRIPTGSGDTLYAWLRILLVAIVAIAGGLAWAALDRRDRPRVHAAVRVWLRYWVAFAMFLYGLAKVFPVQFDVPLEFLYDQRVGDKSPMGLLWLFMGYSRPYTMITGLVEMTAGTLLVWRRTTTLGALVAAIAMTQVTILNFTYDVPVKLFATELLVAALALLGPDARRLLVAALGRAVPEVPPRVRSTPAFERARLAAKLGLLAWVFVAWASMYRRFAPAPAHALTGTWDVAAFTLDGTARPPLQTDGARWARMVFFRDYLMIRFMPETRGFVRVEVDDASHEIVIPVGVERVTWTYARDRDRLVIDGPLDGHRVHAELVRAPEPLLATRGFHWIQEAPFHR